METDTKRKPGRPNTHPDGKLEGVRFFLSPTMRDRIRAEAKSRGVSPSTLIREILAQRYVSGETGYWG